MIDIAAVLMKYLIGLVGITIVVIIHEIGHLVAARFNCIEVEIFSFGIGPKLWGKVYKGCEYRLSLLPLGGYCRLKGSDDLSQALLHDKKHFIHTEEGSLFSVHPLRRVLTYLAGPLFNVLFAIIIYTLLSLITLQVISTESRIATTQDYPHLFQTVSSPAYEQGLRTGDLVLAVSGQPISDWEELETLLLSSKGSEVFEILRDEKTYSFTIHGKKRENNSFYWGLTPIQDLVIGSVRPRSPEYRSGLRRGDRILEVQSVKVSNQLDVLTAIQGHKDLLTFVVSTEGKIRTIQFRPNLNENKEIDLNFALAVQTKPAQTNSFGLMQGLSKTKDLFIQTYTSLRRLIVREEQDVRSSVTGMARSALMIGDITSLGFETTVVHGLYSLLYLMGVVSISLAFANLLPLPAFDGGQMLIALFEWVTKKQISPKTYYRIQLVGITLVILLFIFLLLVDIRHFLTIRR